MQRVQKIKGLRHKQQGGRPRLSAHNSEIAEKILQKNQRAQDPYLLAQDSAALAANALSFLGLASTIFISCQS